MGSKSTAIYNFLEQQIVKGGLKPGDKLPSESELCTEFKVSRGPVRAALDKLTAIGLVYKKKGGGSYVNAQDTENFLNAILPTLKFNTGDYQEMLQLRSALDKLSVELCLKNHEKNNYDELDAVIRAMEGEMSREDFFALDKTFHTIISQLSGNRLLHSINLLIWDLFSHYAESSYLTISNEDRLLEHRNIYNSIKNNDPELAEIYSLRHLRNAMNPEKPVAQDKDPEHHRWNPWLYDTI